MEKNLETVGTVTENVSKAIKTVTTGQLIGLGAGCAAGGAAAGIGGYIGIKALIKRHKDKKAKKEEEKKKTEEKKPEEKKPEEEPKKD